MNTSYFIRPEFQTKKVKNHTLQIREQQARRRGAKRYPTVFRVPLLLMTLTIAGFPLLGGMQGKALAAGPDAQRIAQLEARIAQSGSRVGHGVLERFQQGDETVRVIIKTKLPKPDAEILKTAAGRINGLKARVPSIEDIAGRFEGNEFHSKKMLPIISGFAGEVSIAGLEQLLGDENIEAVYEDKKRRPMLNQGVTLTNSSSVRSTSGGAGISIAILDSGIDFTHPDLGASTDADDFPNAKVIGGFDTSYAGGDPVPTPIDNDGHGTAVAGIAAGNVPSGGAVGDYIGGMAPDAKLYALKITDNSAFAFDSDIFDAVQWVIIHQFDDTSNPILVINLSYGGGSYPGDCDADEPAYAGYMEFVEAAGITMFASSGNDGYTDAMSAPACLSTIVAVGEVYDANVGSSGPWGIDGGTCTDATTAADLVACYSNASPSLALLAPGSNASVTDISGSGGYETTDYVPDFGGTSAATPYAAGAAALLQSAYFADTGSYLTPAELRAMLTSYGDDVEDTRYPTTTFFKRLNVNNSLPSNLLSGDINLDAAVDLKDAILALQVISGGTPSESISTVAEANGNNRIGIEEAINALRVYAAGP